MFSKLRLMRKMTVDVPRTTKMINHLVNWRRSKEEEEEEDDGGLEAAVDVLLSSTTARLGTTRNRMDERRGSTQ